MSADNVAKMLRRSAARRRQQETTEHHRKPESLGGKRVPENISKVPINKHRAWHLLFKNLPPDAIARIINKTWIDRDYEFVVIPRKKPVRR